MKARWKKHIQQAMGKGQKFPGPLPAHHSPQIYSVHQPGISSTPPPFFFFLIEVSLCKYEEVSHWP